MTRVLMCCVALVLPLHVRAQEGDWGTIKGRIVWGEKELPTPKAIKIPENNPDQKVCTKDGEVLSEEWVVNKKTKGLRYTFVWLAPAGKDPLLIHPTLKKIEPEVVMDQPLCMFTPHAVALREGQILVAKNSSTISHNFKWTGKRGTPNEGNNILILAGNQHVIKGLVADMQPIRIECNIHPWMGGWVRVFNHPYYAVTDENGNFEFKNAPAGEFRLFVWHGSGGWRNGAKGKNGEAVKIPAGKTLDQGDLPYVPPPN